jgi:hypothetical protein
MNLNRPGSRSPRSLSLDTHCTHSTCYCSPGRSVSRRATTAIIRTHLINIPARLARSARRVTPHLPSTGTARIPHRRLGTTRPGQGRGAAAIPTGRAGSSGQQRDPMSMVGQTTEVIRVVRDHERVDQLRSGDNDSIECRTSMSLAAELNRATSQRLIQRMPRRQSHHAAGQHISHTVAGQRLHEHSRGHDRRP